VKIGGFSAQLHITFLMGLRGLKILHILFQFQDTGMTFSFLDTMEFLDLAFERSVEGKPYLFSKYLGSL
jgi:hypothetical protein